MEKYLNFKPVINQCWEEILKEELASEYFEKLICFLADENNHANIFPQPNKVFAAFNHTDYDKIKVVIIGQDPYHGKGQANGLCFSVSEGIKLPPSLRNIFKELRNDIGHPVSKSGDLTKWANQGVLLLNTILTVKESSPGSHQNKGWEKLTDVIIKNIAQKKEEIIFLLWGRYAQEKAKLIDSTKHYILTASHPSPLSAYNGFWGCKHFSKTNEILKKLGKKEIDWKLDE